MKSLALIATALTFAGAAQAQTPELHLSGRFAPVSLEVSLRGEQSLGTMENDCVGAVGLAPTLILHFDPGATPPRAIEIRLTSGTDTVLGVLTPGERLDSSGGPRACSDDDGGGINPLVRLETPGPGTYRIMAGPFATGETARATLDIRAAD